MTFPILMRTVMNQFIPDHEHLMLDLKQVCQLTRLSKSTVYRLELKGSFPKRIRISERRVVWRALEIYDFITERVEESLNG
jgi:predicted DNA-binding transcriptional regulator AlpA